ncbi:MAG: RES family NAD+ phosphorylase [Novosphingobium sp.]|nr:RES family NAD+ phosphorylase [Novosphingobium sp.]
MKLWRLARPGQLALDGEGARLHGGRYSSPGRPVVALASEAGLAVLVTLRYAMHEPDWMEAEYCLGWTVVDASPERIEPDLPREATTRWVDDWLDSRRSLLATIRSHVLPEADVVFLNPLHAAAGKVPPLVARPFRFADCLHRPPALDQFREV